MRHPWILFLFAILFLTSCFEQETKDRFKLSSWNQEFPLKTSSDIQKLEKKYFRSQLSVLQNITTSDETILTILKNKTLELKYLIYNSKGLVAESTPHKTLEVHESYDVAHLLLQNLKPGEDYFLVISDKSQFIVDTRRFSVLSETKKSLRIAVASCARVGLMGGDYGPLSIWDELKNENPDALFFLGDWVYPDNLLQALFYLKPSLQEIKDRYVESWLTLNIFRQSKLIPSFSILDDHDYGFQGANSLNNFERQHLMFQYFRSFFPTFEVETPKFKQGPGSSFWIQFYKLNLIMLDNKYFRTASGPDGVVGLIWGPDQLDWLSNILTQNPLPSFIGSGTLMTFPVFNQDAAQYESPDEFAEFLKALRHATQPVILLSGDVHYSDVKKLPTELLQAESYEITSSRIHSINPLMIPPFISGFVGPEKGQLIHSSDKNFVILDIPQDDSFKNMTVEIHNKNSRNRLRTQIFSESK